MSRSEVDDFKSNPDGPAYVVTTNNGFRDWELTRRKDPHTGTAWTFESLVMAYPWHPGVNTSQCFRPIRGYTPGTTPDRCPGYPTAGCTCGFYAYYRTQHWASASTIPQVSGIVEGWGRCVVGPYGFRAEYAKPVALLIEPPRIPLGWLDMRNISRNAALAIMREKVAELMPGVPLYDRLSDMLADHPLRGRPDV